MKYINIILLIILFGGVVNAQRLFTAGIVYTDRAPTYNPGATGSRVAIDTTTFDVYLYKSGTTWEKAGRGIDEVTGCVKPTYTPSKFDAKVAISMTCDSIWRYRSGVWRCANCSETGATYTAGAGIDITGTTITNTGDLSNTNELQTLSTGTNTLTLSNSGGTVTVDTDPTNDITTSTTANGDLSGTYPNPTVDGIQGRSVSATAPSSGKVLKWDGTSWTPDAPYTGTTNQTLRHNGSSFVAVDNVRIPDAANETAPNMLWRKTNHNNVFINKGSSPVPIITGSTFSSLTLGSWSPNVLHIPEMGDILWGPDGARWTKTASGSTAAGGNTYVIRYIANVPNIVIANGGVLYPAGKMYFGFYNTWRPASISVRMKNSAGTWYGPWAVDMSQGDNSNPDIFPVYSLPIAGGFSNEITEVEITMTTRSDVITYPEFINWFVNNPQYLRGARFFDKNLSNERLFGTVDWADNSANIKASISPTNVYFNTNVGVGTSNPSPSAKLQVVSTSSGFAPPQMTTTQRDAIPTGDPIIIFNTTTQKFQGRFGTTWVDLH